ncbi:MAG TPA: NAD(P)-dependent oxidoreductase [Sphingobacteriaceae bacterium]
MIKKILIADDLHPVFREEAVRMGFDVTDAPSITKEEVLKSLHEYHVLAIRTKFRIDREVMDAGTRLRCIARAGAGMDNIDEAYALEKGIACINAPEGNRDAVAEHALGLLLSLMNNFRKADAEVRSGIWDREGNRGWELKGKTVGIIGYGNTGRAFARKLAGLDVNILAYDKYQVGFSDSHVTETVMEEIVKKADVLSLHIPLTRETRAMVDDEYLFHFRKPIFLINTSRGEIVRTPAVLNAVRQGKILGAGLDVLEVEKFPALGEQEWFTELAADPRVILTPHVAGWTFDSYRRISEVLAEKLKNLQL